MAYNKVTLHGRLSKDVEYRESTDGKGVAKTSIAVGRRGEGTDFINLVAFGKTAEMLNKYFSKGKEILIEGRIQTGSYEKDGKKVYTTDVVVESVDFCGNKSDSPAKDGNGFVDVASDTDAELPFM